MFGKILIKAPTKNGGQIATGEVTVFREKTENVRILLAPESDQLLVATARSSTSTGFSIDLARANPEESWKEEFILVNWFLWGEELDRKSLKTELRGSFRLSNSTRVGRNEYIVPFGSNLDLIPTAVIVSSRNENRAQVIAVNVIGSPQKDMFTIRLMRIDDQSASIEEEGTFIDWIAAFPSAEEQDRNRSGTGTQFSRPFLKQLEGPTRILVIPTVQVEEGSPLKPKILYVVSVEKETLEGFQISRVTPVKPVSETSSVSETRSLENVVRERGVRIMYLAWDGLEKDCNEFGTCENKGSCVYSRLNYGDEVDVQNIIPSSQCACISPFSGYQCTELCPIDEDGLVCSGNGRCSQTIPECECLSGWNGDICERKAYSADSRLVLLLLFLTCICTACCVSAWFTSKYKRRMTRKRRLLDLRMALLGDGDDESDEIQSERFEQIDDAMNENATSWAIPFDKLILGAQIGQGSSSQVFVGLWESQNVAIKKIGVPRFHRKQSSDNSLDFWLYFRREASLLANLHHPNIVRFFGVASQQDYRETRHMDYFYIVTELCMASMSDLIRGPVLKKLPKFGLTKPRQPGLGQMLAQQQQQDGRDDDPSGVQEFVLSVLNQIVRGMDFLHSKGVVHRDLKCDNVLLDNQNQVKLCDFGISRMVDRSNGFIKGTTAMIATPAFMAPELIITGSFPVGTKVDVFSFGIVFWAFLNWSEPYVELQANNSVFDLMSKITTQGLRPKVDALKWSEPLQRFYFRCVHVNPDERPSFHEITALFQNELANDIRQAWSSQVSHHPFV